MDTVTISGPAELVKQFVAELKEEEIFAKEVQSAGVAFHSYFMAKTAPALKAALQKVQKSISTQFLFRQKVSCLIQLTIVSQCLLLIFVSGDQRIPSKNEKMG